MAFDYRSYDMRDLFTMAEVARLWCEIESFKDENKHCANSMIHAMREAIGLGVLVPEQSLAATIMLRPDSNELVFSRKQLRPWAEMRGQRPPFLFPEDRAQERKPAPRESEIMKERCQAIAALKWRDNPNISITDLANDPDIKLFGYNNGSYTIRTVKLWLSEVDPRPPEVKKTPFRKTNATAAPLLQSNPSL